MKRIVGGMTLFLFGTIVALVSTAWADATLYRGKEPRAAAEALLARAETVAGTGSWERIAIGAVYFQSGDRAKGQSYFDAVLNGEPEPSDYLRIGLAYARAGEWEMAKPMLQKSIELRPKDDDGLAQIAAWYIYKGERERGEELLERALLKTRNDPWFYADAAGAYLGLEPLP